MTASLQQLYDGSTVPEPERLALRAGPLTMFYEQGTLRHIRYGNIPVLHQIYAAVRDQNWGTVPGEISNYHVDISELSFAISFDMNHRADGIDFTWQGRIMGQDNGTLTFIFDGTAKSSFLRNRIGFCVLYPMSVAGQSCSVEHTDGSQEAGIFPELVSPHQPFFDIRAISHEVLPGVTACVLMEGDTFEMEDQRNWTDASYKTYCTPLGLPFPVLIRSDERVSQKITLSLSGNVHQLGTAEASPIVITSKAVSQPMPKIGLGLPSGQGSLSVSEYHRLKRLNLAHLRAEIHLYETTWNIDLNSALRQIAQIATPLELAIFVSDNAEKEMESFAQILVDLNEEQITRIAIFHRDEKSTSRKWVDIARKHLGYLGVPIGAGTDAFFAELNRERPETGAIDFVIWSINPQVHASDNLSLVETLAAQAVSVRTARSFSKGKPLVISPITFRMRWNPNATGKAPSVPPGELPPRVDPRQMSLFGAGWTLGSIKYCAEAGVDSLTYFETVGWLGVMETAKGSFLPQKFASQSGSVFPMYHTFAAIGDFRDCEVIISESSDPLSVEVLWLRQGNHIRILITNLTVRPQNVEIIGISTTTKLHVLDEINVAQMCKDPTLLWNTPQTQQPENKKVQLSLLPYALAVIDFIEGSNND